MTAFASAAHTFAALVHALPDASWDAPGLGDWDIRSLVGHTSRSLVTVSGYLQTPAEREDVPDAVAYYVWVREYLASAAAEESVERGRQAGRELGRDPAATVDDLVARALADLDGAGDPLIAVIGGLGIRLSHYLQTRVFELAVHGLDIARAAGVDFELPADVLDEATVLATRLAVELGQGDTVLLALTGRVGLPSPFSVT